MQWLQKAINGLKLPEECEWFTPGSGFTCQARDVGLDAYVECLEKESCRCPFSVSYAYSYFCTFPPRVYVVKELEK
jgi:hypothetical protein